MYAKFKTLIAILILLILFSATVYSHPGRTDANGGHYVRTAGWGYPVGSYHYHNQTYTPPSTTSQPTTTQPSTTKPTTSQLFTTKSTTFQPTTTFQPFTTKSTTSQKSTTRPITYSKATNDKNSSINNFVSPVNSSIILKIIEDLSNQNGTDLFLTLLGTFLVILWAYLFIEFVIIQQINNFMSSNKKSSKKSKKIILIVLRIIAVITSFYATYWLLKI